MGLFLFGEVIMAYFSNGSEGSYLDEQCDECAVANDAPCPVLFVQTHYNYDQLKDGNELLREAINMLVDEKGNCKMKTIIDKNLVDDKKTINMFGG